MNKEKKLVVGDISYETARDYLHNLNDPFLRKLFSRFTGGTFRSTQIKEWKKEGFNNKKFSGLMFWFCVNETLGILDFSIVMEPKFDFDYNVELGKNPNIKKWRPTSPNLLYLPGQSFGENIYDLNYENKLNKLKSHELQIFNGDVNAEIVSVNNGIEQFLNDSRFRLFNSSPFSYFNETDWDRNIPRHKIDFFKLFFGQSNSIKFIRYYLGFDSSENPYNVRLIIVPVGSGGKNFVKFQKEKSVLLQYSWPPPPNS
jgi:hypothetical protein